MQQLDAYNNDTRICDLLFSFISWQEQSYLLLRTVMKMQSALFSAVLAVLVLSGDTSHTKLKHLDKTELLKEILTRYFLLNG